MGIQKFKVCECCGLTLPATREFFKRKKNKETGKEEYHSICRTCEDVLLIAENWKDGKLKCHTCGQWLDPSEFSKHNNYSYRDYKDKRCNKCKQELNKKARENYSDELRLLKVLLERWLNAKSRAESKLRDFTISKEDLKTMWDKLKGLCAISGIPMTYELDNGRVYTNVSIDRIDSSKGYTLDNILLVCMSVNLLKSDLPLETVIFLCNQIIQNLKKSLN